MRRALLVLLVLATAAGGAACGGGDDAATGTSTTTVTTARAPVCDVVGDDHAAPTSNLEVTLDEWSIAAGPAAAGQVRVQAHNAGDVEHELVLERADGTRIGKIEPFASGDTCQGTFQLTAGTYELFCGIVDEGGTSHRDAGMEMQLIVK